MAQLGFWLAHFLFLLGRLEPCRVAIAPLELLCEVLGAGQAACQNFLRASHVLLTYGVRLPRSHRRHWMQKRRNSEEMRVSDDLANADWISLKPRIQSRVRVKIYYRVPIIKYLIRNSGLHQSTGHSFPVSTYSRPRSRMRTIGSDVYVRVQNNSRPI